MIIDKLKHWLGRCPCNCDLWLNPLVFYDEGWRDHDGPHCQCDWCRVNRSWPNTCPGLSKAKLKLRARPNG